MSLLAPCMSISRRWRVQNTHRHSQSWQNSSEQNKIFTKKVCWLQILTNTCTSLISRFNILFTQNLCDIACSCHYHFKHTELCKHCDAKQFCSFNSVVPPLRWNHFLISQCSAKQTCCQHRKILHFHQHTLQTLGRLKQRKKMLLRKLNLRENTQVDISHMKDGFNEHAPLCSPIISSDLFG